MFLRCSACAANLKEGRRDVRMEKGEEERGRGEGGGDEGRREEGDMGGEGARCEVARV